MFIGGNSGDSNSKNLADAFAVKIVCSALLSLARILSLAQKEPRSEGVACPTGTFWENRPADGREIVQPSADLVGDSRLSFGMQRAPQRRRCGVVLKAPFRRFVRPE